MDASAGHHGHPVVPGPGPGGNGGGNNNLNINLPENNNAILRLEVELRDKNVAKYRRGGGGGPGIGRVGGAPKPNGAQGPALGPGQVLGAPDTTTLASPLDSRNLVVPLEKVSCPMPNVLFQVPVPSWSSGQDFMLPQALKVDFRVRSEQG